MEAKGLVVFGWEHLGVAVEPPCSCKREFRLKQEVWKEGAEPEEPLGSVEDPVN